MHEGITLISMESLMDFLNMFIEALGLLGALCMIGIPIGITGTAMYAALGMKDVEEEDDPEVNMGPYRTAGEVPVKKEIKEPEKPRSIIESLSGVKWRWNKDRSWPHFYFGFPAKFRVRRGHIEIKDWSQWEDLNIPIEESEQLWLRLNRELNELLQQETLRREERARKKANRLRQKADRIAQGF